MTRKTPSVFQLTPQCAEATNFGPHCQISQSVGNRSHSADFQLRASNTVHLRSGFPVTFDHVDPRVETSIIASKSYSIGPRPLLMVFRHLESGRSLEPCRIMAFKSSAQSISSRCQASQLIESWESGSECVMHSDSFAYLRMWVCLGQLYYFVRRWRLVC
ncbi:hypothetical protein BDR22DRAFT_116917 [Usnea florida]